MSQEIKDDATSLFGKISDWVKGKLNNLTLPGLISFIYQPKAKDPFNPTADEIVQNSNQEGIWNRLKLGNISPLGVPYWVVLALPIVTIIVYISKGALQFFIEIVGQAIILVPLAIILVIMWKNFKR